MQKDTCCTADFLATFDLFDKSPAFLNFSSPQLVRWSAYWMQKSACKKTQDFYWFFIWKVYSGIPRPTGQKKKRKTNKIPAPWTMLDTVKLRGKGSLAQHGQEPWTHPKTTQNHKPRDPLTKTIVRLWTQTRTFLVGKPLHQSTSLTSKRVHILHNLPHHLHSENKTRPCWELYNTSIPPGICWFPGRLPSSQQRA